MNLENNRYYLTTEINNEILILKKIPHDDIDLIMQHIDTLLDFRYYARKLKEIDLNHIDFTSKFNYYRNILSKKADDNIDLLNDIYIDLNRLFVNFITSIRVLIEHLEKRLSHKYNKDSEEFRSFKKFTKSCYNKYFSYRLFYQLRNFSIHTDYPINSFFCDYEYNDGNDVNKFDFKVEFQKSHLLKNKTLKSKLDSDFRLYNEKFPVIPLMKEILLPVNSFLPFIVNMDSSYYIKAAEFIQNYTTDIKNIKEISISKWTQVNKSQGKWNLKILPLALVNTIFDKKTLPKNVYKK